MAKTLLPEIANSPYFIKYPGRNFSQVLFKPGYPLQSAELISLQNIVNEQISRFGDHVFKDGSMVTTSGGFEKNGGIDYDHCQLYELSEDANLLAFVPENSTIVIKDTTVDINLDISTVLEADFVTFKNAFIKDGIVYPNYMGLKFNNGQIQQNLAELFSTSLPSRFDVYVKFSNNVLGSKIGTLNSLAATDGMFAMIKDTVFYTSGYFTNIEEQKLIYHIGDASLMNVEVGVELQWEIADISHPTYGSQLFDPAQNAFNENSPGADRLILNLMLKEHDLNYVQSNDDWKFTPLLKFKNGDLIYRIKYPIYSVLGDTLARTTYEIHGNFVIDPFKLNVTSDALLTGTHTVTEYDNSLDGETVYTITGSETTYTNLTIGNYVMFGSVVDYNRLLKIVRIDSDLRMKVSDVHYDSYPDFSTNSPDYFSEAKVGTTISLRDEEKLNYVLSEGKAYVNGYRFETTFQTKIEDNKSRDFKAAEAAVLPNQHYFELSSYFHTENFINFKKLDTLDLHCTKNKELYQLTISLSTAFNLPIVVGINEELEINGTIFKNIKTTTTNGGDVISNYELISYSNNTNTGLPTIGVDYTVTNRTNGTQNIYRLKTIEKIADTPFERDSSTNYSANILNDNYANTSTISIVSSTLDFENTSTSYNNSFAQDDYVLIEDVNDVTVKVFGLVTNIPGNPSSSMTVKTNTTVFTNNATEYRITKPSYNQFYDYQYGSTKIGTIRSNSVGVDDPERFRFSHYELNHSIKSFDVVKVNTVTNKIEAVSLELSQVDDVYNGMFIEYNGSTWEISDYVGATQEFTLLGVSALNPINFAIGDNINLTAHLSNLNSIISSAFANGKGFYGNVVKNTLGYPVIKTPNQTQNKFSSIIDNEDGEVKNVRVDDYSIFYQEKWIVTGVDISSLSKAIGTDFISDFNIDNNNVKVYAATNILDGTTNYLKYSSGQSVPFSSVTLVGSNLTINFNETFNNTDAFIVHANIPVSQPLLRYKTLKNITDAQADVDDFTVYVNGDGTLLGDITNTRNHTQQTFELKHSDIYRIRSVQVSVGKLTGPYVDITDYFTLDDGQRATHYDHGRLVLKSYLKLPDINNLDTSITEATITAASQNVYRFRVNYDFFEPTNGHFFTVDSYTNIHYRKIPTYIDSARDKFPLRNVIDFRPVRRPIGSISDYEQETDIVSIINLDFDYYYHKEKVIALQGNGTSEIKLVYQEAENYVPSFYNIKLYEITLPAYTFEFEDINYKLIDNKNYTMKDISKLQKRIENLEDIAQLNALELQAIQTKLTDVNGNPRFTNGLLVDMFSGFAIAKVDQEGFAASIDIEQMKLYPSFSSNNSLLHIAPTTSISNNFPTVKNNIAYLPIAGHNEIVNSFDTNITSTLNSQLSFKNGKLTLHPYSDVWYSKDSTPIVLLNEDNQFKNWKLLRSSAHGTQWKDWEQFWSGVPVESNILTVANATLSQKTGRLINNKNNIEKVINDKRVNTTLTLKSRAGRIGFVFEMLSKDVNEYGIYINSNLVTTNAGQRITFTTTSGLSVNNFRTLYQGLNITQNAVAGLASGVVNHIQHISNKDYYLYVTNIDNYIFDTSAKINELNGSISAIHTYGTSRVSLDDNSILCGDFTIGESDYPSGTALDVQIRDLNAQTNNIVGSNKFYINGLLETKTSFVQSIRPAQRKLYSDSESNYIDDKTFVINNTTRIPTPIHQPFILNDSVFLSKFSFRYTCNQDSKVIITIQPMVNNNLSPSLVVPFSEKIISLPLNTTGTEYEVEYDIPIFLASNKEYAIVFRSENDVHFYTHSNFNSNIFIDQAVGTNGISSNGSVLQLKLYSAVFNTNQREMTLNIKESTYNENVDRYRLNINSLDLTDTNINYRWKAKNYDTNVQDILYQNIPANETKLLEKRKIFTPNDYELIVNMNSNDARVTPMIDLSRFSLTTVNHKIDNGLFLQNNVSITRTGANTDRVQLTLTEYDPNGIHNRKCIFTVDALGNINNFFSDPKFLLNVSEYTVTIKKFDTVSNTFVNYNPAVSISSDSFVRNRKNITDTTIGLKIILDLITEYDATAIGNTSYRYYSPIVTLADDFEAMQLYVQMDAVLRRTNDVFVFYRVLENTQSFDTFKEQHYKLMNIKTNDADKYTNSIAKTIEFESNRTDPPDSRFKYFQIKVCFTSTNYIEIPVVENIRILALDN